MRSVYRIITLEGRLGLFDATPKQILQQGSNVYTLPPKQRLYEIRKVFYEQGTPLYANPISYQKKYDTIKGLIDDNKQYVGLIDKPILDLNNSLKTYCNDEICAIRKEKI